jgi:hypothetical protein
MGYLPKRPTGNDPEALFMQWVFDELTIFGRLVSVPGKISFERTTRGIIPVLNPQRGNAAGEQYPFRIYKGTTWLNAKVATGHILTTGDLVTPSNVDTDLTLVTATAKNWIYVDLTSTTATLAASATLPTWAVDKIPIGYVDTTNTSAELQVITQIRKEHIFDPCL